MLADPASEDTQISEELDQIALQMSAKREIDETEQGQQSEGPSETCERPAKIKRIAHLCVNGEAVLRFEMPEKAELHLKVSCSPSLPEAQ